MTAEIPSETIKLVTAALDYIEDNADFRGIDGAQLQQFVVCVRSLIAHATEMQAVFKAKDRPDKPGRWFHYDCIEGKDGWLNYSENDIAACHVNPPTCGKFIGPFALTETPRPATTGEGMGEG